MSDDQSPEPDPCFQPNAVCADPQERVPLAARRGGHLRMFHFLGGWSVDSVSGYCLKTPAGEEVVVEARGRKVITVCTAMVTPHPRE